MQTAILTIVWLISLCAIPHVLFARKRPAATLAWIWGILLFPGLGALAYFALGADRIRRKRLRKAARAKLPRRQGDAPGVEALVSALAPPDRRLLRLLARVNDTQTTTAAEVRLLFDADEFYPALKKSIDTAEDHIHIEFFIWRDDAAGTEFRDALVRAAERGVEVRLLLDQIGCWGVSKRFFAPIVQAGGQMSWFYSLPLWRHSRFMNLRNHRKLQIIDGTIAYVGGMNIGSEHLGEGPGRVAWRDTQLLLRGQAVGSLQETFATDWFFATNERLSDARYFPPQSEEERHLVQPLPGGPDLPREPVPKTLAAILSVAKRRVWISTGYFVPDTLMLTILQLTAARDVDVRLLVSAKTDHRILLQVGRSFYGDLLSWGVRIFEYHHAIVHRKAILCDDEWMMIGSANSDNRSMRLNFELNVFVHSPEETRRLEAVLGEEFERSTEIFPSHLAERPFSHRLLEAAFRPLAPLL